MIKAYLDSYNKITVLVNKNYCNGNIQSLCLLTAFGLQDIGKIEFKEEKQDYIQYEMYSEFEFQLGGEYYLVDEKGLKILLMYRYITKCERFIKETFTNDYLGYEYSKERTTFNLWAPISAEIILVIDDNKYFKMERNNNIFRYTIEEDMDGRNYYFLVKNNGIYNKVLDPYSYSYNFDQSASVVIDLNDLIKNKQIDKSKKSKVIYEANVGDFSSFKNIKYKSKFLGIIDNDSMKYLNNLGIEYLQLMPINYFNGNTYNNDSFYSWGHNPCLFGVPHPNYVYNLEDSKSVINECKMMINMLHSEGIKVVMNVGFANMSNKEDNSLNLIVPHYYVLDNNEMYSASLDSEALMAKRLILDMCIRWVKLYGIDGFKFDSISTLSYEIINEVYDSLKQIKKEIVVYGDGLEKPHSLKEDISATLINVDKMKNIGLFNEYYRESLQRDNIKEDVVKGNCVKNNKLHFSKLQSVNYIESYKGYESYGLQFCVESKDEEVKKKQLFKTLVVLLSNGYSFIRSGQEMLKHRKELNSFDENLDDINMFDWNKLCKHNKEVELVEKMIKLREKHNLFSVDYEYKDANGIINLKSNDLEIVMNLSNDDIKVNDDEVILATNNKTLKKYDLAVYKRKGGKVCLKN